MIKPPLPLKEKSQQTADKRRGVKRGNCFPARKQLPQCVQVTARTQQHEAQEAETNKKRKLIITYWLAGYKKGFETMELTRQAAITEVKRNLDCRTMLKPSKGGLFVCPYCGSGTGSNGTGAMKYYPETNTTYCHKCNRSADPLDLLQVTESLDFNSALKEAANRLSFRIATYSNRTAPEIDSTDADDKNNGNYTEAPEGGLNGEIGQPADYRNYYLECCRRLNDPDAMSYLSGRGISYETAKAAYIGYDPAADPANAPGGNGELKHPCPRLILPTGRAHYVGRRIDGKKDFDKLNSKGGKPGLFNAAALTAGGEIIFVTEGAFDALSILEAGAQAVALNSASNAGLFLKELERHPLPPEKILALALDNDDAGRKAAQEIEAGAQRLNIGCIRASICGEYKDPNEHLQKNRAAFMRAVAGVSAARPDDVSSYISFLMAEDLKAFQEANDLKTGFSNLDAQTGGLYSGLYVVASISSLGKTTFCHQCADQLAGQGHDVIFFSMEQSRLELVSKSIARRTAQNDIAAAGGKPEFKTAVTSLAIRRGYLPECVLQAADDYKNAIGNRLSIVEGNFNCDIAFIGAYIKNYIKRTGRKPIIFIDYLQVLQPSADDSKRQKREIVDAAMTELKRLSREMNLTIIVICSVNRANYMTPIDFESLKESGSIEFTADCVFGLQLQVLNTALFDSKESIKQKRQAIREAKAADPRKIELLCLKNRFGISSFSCYFDYYPKFDLFREGLPSEEFIEKPQRKAGTTFKRGHNT